MKIKFLEQMMFRLSGRSMPCAKIDDVDDKGLVGSIQFVGDLKLRANSLQNTWETKAYEIKKESKKITIIDRAGITTTGYFISPAGETVNLYTDPRPLPDGEDVLGSWSMMDDIADSMNLLKSMKNMAIGVVIGIFLGWMIVGPMFSKLLG
jgi:hypothetical protein